MVLTYTTEHPMVTMHCTYPDGETSEARYGLTMEQALWLLTDDAWPDTAADTLVDMPAFLDGEVTSG